MRTNIQRLAMITFVAAATSGAAWRAAFADAVLEPVSQRYAAADVDETPDFQRHISPLMGRLGCNGRACHGSFQGRGGFRLSLFGYDFKADHDALFQNNRVNVEAPLDSLIISKPTNEDEHEGGERYERESWQYHVIRRWIEAGAPYDKAAGIQKLESLEIVPSEIVFATKDEHVQLKAIAHWANGTIEDVTPLCRFQSNSSQVADITEDGLVTSKEPGDTHVVVFYDNAVQPIPVMQPVTGLVGDQYPSVPTPTKVDELVVRKLRKLGIVPSDLSSDAEFLRRVSLDMTGSLPTPEEVKKFLADESKDKRARKIDELLETPAYAAWWTTKLCDFTGNNDFQLNNFLPAYNRNANTASKIWYDWIYKRVADNTSYDDLCEGLILATSRKDGQSYTEYCDEMSGLSRDDAKTSYADLDHMPLYWARRDFRDAEPRAINFAYAFLGIRIECAQCHKHPFDQWSKDDFAEFTNFFRQVAASNGQPVNREERGEYEKILKDLKLDPSLRGNQQRQEFGKMLSEGKTVPFSEVYVGSPRPSRGDDIAVTEMKSAKLLGGEAFELKRNEDVRKPLMEWLRAKDNPLFARAFVNRVWAAYFNRGIVEPPDENSLANPPCNKPLLDHLAQGFIDSEFDMKWLHREITNSRTYQLSWQPNETNARDEVNFSHAVPRRLPAEAVYDALTQATASDDKILAMHESIDGRAIAIPGASNRANGGGRGDGNAAYALQVFGRSIRESNCDCDRSMESSLLQTVFMQNDQQVYSMIDLRGGWLDELARTYKLGRTAEPEKPAGKRPDNYEALVEKTRQKIKRMQKDGNDREANKLQQQLDQQLAKFGDPDKRDAAPAESQKADTSLDKAAVVQQAYLRTLSRYPDQRELQRSVEYIDQAADTLNGVRGLLWALLNTKEFIVNH